jgi:hypothetical protein
MGVIMLKCPHTAREFSTGILIDQESFQKLPKVPTRAHCPHCGLTHVWWPREARWVGSVTGDPSVERLDRAS